MSSPNPVVAPAHIHALLEQLHARSLEQESRIDPTIYRRVDNYSAEFDDVMRDQFVALEQDKAQLVYQVARMIAAKNIVEAGTSFGVSTIYLALAVGQNGGGKVFATEKESAKAKIAREHWKEAGKEVEPYIELREGNLLETLSKDLPSIDLLLLDIWAPLALPTLKVVQPSLRSGAVIIVDNTISGKDRYGPLLEYLRAPNSRFTSLTLPYSNGLELVTYQPQQ